MNEVIPVIKVSPDGFNPIVFRIDSESELAMDEVKSLITYGESGDSVIVERDEMAAADFENLHEHQGW